MAFNMSALFVIQFYKDQMMETIKYADYVFCNEDEGSAFATANGFEATDRVGAAKFVATYEKANSARSRVVIITQGAEPTIVVTGKPGEEPVVELIAVAPIEVASIVDTNGAGDSFVGGFFSQLAQDKTLTEAVNKGNEIAGKVIQKSGCVFE